MPSLDSILSATRRRVSESRSRADFGAWERNAAEHTPRGFRRQLQQSAKNGVAIIAELKKASPSKGLIRAAFDPVDLARDLEHAGAAALSVLTDDEFFQGSLDNLQRASAATALPCLRKDFIVDEMQLLEARAYRADAILLIVAALEQRELLALSNAARTHALDVLCEVHDATELQRALDAGCDLIGVNSRDLRTFQVDLATAFGLAEKIPAKCLGVAESGIHTASDMAHLRAAGYEAFLIGESLMRAEHPGEALRNLVKEVEAIDHSSKLEARSS